MSFEFDKFIQSKDIAVAVVTYGGPAYTFDGMSVYKQNLFLNQLFESGIRDFEEFIVHHTDPIDWYQQYVHYTSIAVPVWITVAMSDKVVFNKPLLNIQESISQVVSAIEVAGNSNLYVYSNKDKDRFNRWLHIMKAKGDIITDNHFTVRAFEDVCKPGICFDTLDEHLVAFDMPLGEFISAPHYVYMNAPDRLKTSLEEKTLSFWKMTQLL